MLRYSIQRFLQMIPTVIIVSFMIFMLIHMIPGDPVATMLGYTAEGMTSGAYSQATYDEMTKKLVFDHPLLIQYKNWVVKTVQGDWGDSFVSGMKVLDIIKARIPPTI